MAVSSSAAGSGAGVAPTRNFLKSFGAGLFEEADAMPGVLEFVNVRPHLGLPAVIMDGAGTAGGAAGVQLLGDITWPGLLGLQFDEDAAHLLNVVLVPDHMFVTQQVTKAQFASLMLGLGPGVERAIFGPQLFG